MGKLLLVLGVIFTIAATALLAMSIFPHLEASRMFSLVEQAEHELETGVDEFGNHIDEYRRLHVVETLESRLDAYKSSRSGRNLFLMGFCGCAVVSTSCFAGRKMRKQADT